MNLAMQRALERETSMDDSEVNLHLLNVLRRELPGIVQREIATTRKITFALYGRSNSRVFAYARRQTRGLCKALRRVRAGRISSP